MDEWNQDVQANKRNGPVFTFSSSIHFEYIRVSSIKCHKKH